MYPEKTSITSKIAALHHFTPKNHALPRAQNIKKMSIYPD